MTQAATNGQAAWADTLENEVQHFRQAEDWLEKAEDAYRDGHTAGESVDRMLRFAAVHARLATSADVDREADAEVRLAACVADGGSAFDVNVRGPQR